METQAQIGEVQSVGEGTDALWWRCLDRQQRDWLEAAHAAGEEMTVQNLLRDLRVEVVRKIYRQVALDEAAAPLLPRSWEWLSNRWYQGVSHGRLARFFLGEESGYLVQVECREEQRVRTWERLSGNGATTTWTGTHREWKNWAVRPPSDLAVAMPRGLLLAMKEAQDRQLFNRFVVLGPAEVFAQNAQTDPALLGVIQAVLNRTPHVYPTSPTDRIQPSTWYSGEEAFFWLGQWEPKPAP